MGYEFGIEPLLGMYIHSNKENMRYLYMPNTSDPLIALPTPSMIVQCIDLAPFTLHDRIDEDVLQNGIFRYF